MKIQTEINGDILTLHLSGVLDLAHSSEVRDVFKQALQDHQNAKQLIVDMKDVRTLDSSGLASLVELMKNTRNAGIELRLTELNPSVKAVFELSRLDQIFTIG
jgi:anti-sigma B factor antagonist